MSAKTITTTLSRTSVVRLTTSNILPLTTITLVNAGYERSITFNEKEIAALKAMLAEVEKKTTDTLVDVVEASIFAYDSSFFDEAPTDKTCITIIEESK